MGQVDFSASAPANMGRTSHLHGVDYLGLWSTERSVVWWSHVSCPSHEQLLARYVCLSVTSWTGCIHHATAVCPTVPPTAWSLATEGLHFFSSLRRLQATRTSFSLHKSSLHIFVHCLICTTIQYMRGYKVTTTERLIVQTSTLYEARRVLYTLTHSHIKKSDCAKATLISNSSSLGFALFSYRSPRSKAIPIFL